jgi:hypothetical protein
MSLSAEDSQLLHFKIDSAWLQLPNSITFNLISNREEHGMSMQLPGHLSCALGLLVSAKVVMLA